MAQFTPEYLLREGNPRGALDQLQERVRKNPTDPKLRIFLFQLLALLGQWERAHTQLEVCGELDAANLAMVQTYRDCLGAEQARSLVLQGRISPVVFGQPEPWMALLIEALRLTAEGRHAESADLRDQAYEQAPVTPGCLEGVGFDWIADADTRLGPMLEAVLNGRYVWIPFSRLTRVAVEPPTDLRDLVWAPARLTFSNGGESVALIPTRYPGSADAEDSAILMARATRWIEPSPGHFHGLGQRLLATPQGEHPLLDIRELKLDPAPVDSHA